MATAEQTEAEVTEAPEAEPAPEAVAVDPTPELFFEKPETVRLLKGMLEAIGLNREVSRLTDEHEEAKAAASAVKKRLEAAQDRLNAHIRRVDQAHEDMPLFDRGDPGADADAPAEPEAWRSFGIATLADFGLADTIVSKLTDAGIETIGDLADWTAMKSLTDIPGVGGATAEKIESALEGFWKLNSPQPAAEGGVA